MIISDKFFAVAFIQISGIDSNTGLVVDNLRFPNFICFRNDGGNGERAADNGEVIICQALHYDAVGACRAVDFDDIIIADHAAAVCINRHVAREQQRIALAEVLNDIAAVTCKVFNHIRLQGAFDLNQIVSGAAADCHAGCIIAAVDDCIVARARIN